MKLTVAVALVAASIPVQTMAAAAPGGDGASSDRRVCTQVAQARAGSRMTARRICRTATQWREALGPDWRQHLAGARGLQDDYESMSVRMTPDDGPPHGQQPLQGGFNPGGAAGPR